MSDELAAVLIKHGDGASVALYPCTCIRTEHDVLIAIDSLDVPPERRDEVRIDNEIYVIGEVRRELVHYRCRYR